MEGGRGDVLIFSPNSRGECTKKAPPGDRFDQPPGRMSIVGDKLCPII